MNRSSATLQLAGLLGVILGLVGCGSDSPNPVQPPPPPPAQNLAPVVRSVNVEQARVEVDTAIRIEASVEDAETPVDGLQYEWTATAGTFAGEGRQVTWRAPSDIPEPLNVTFNLTVVENVNRNGVVDTNRTTFSATDAVRVHDSEEELEHLAETFLRDFIDDSVSPSRCVRNFSDSCSGKQSELEDVQTVRSLFSMLPSSSYSIRSILIDPPWERAHISARCEFVSQAKVSGLVDSARGTCLLVAIYEEDEWRLCESHFSGTTTNPQFMVR